MGFGAWVLVRVRLPSGWVVVGLVLVFGLGWWFLPGLGLGLGRVLSARVGMGVSVEVGLGWG